MPLVLNYHDVVTGDGPDADDASGLPGPLAARYKVPRAEFLAHLEAIAAAVAGPPHLTFDDGGLSAYTVIADALEARGWRGHFFVATGFLGRPSFVTAAQVRDLHARGHRIGSHSHNHPRRMACCPPEVLDAEWRESRAALADLLGAPVETASVPGGFYSPAVARAAGRAGLAELYTSEPTTRPRAVGGCAVLGRYTVYRGMTARHAAALAAGRLGPRLRQSFHWGVKKAAKAAGGRFYLVFQDHVVRRR